VRYWSVLIEGTNLYFEVRRFWLWRRPRRHGFYTTRYVVAEDMRNAVEGAIALVRSELHEREVGLTPPDDVMLAIDKVTELESFEGVNPPGRGFVFYPDY
jgi:hypothetical protein